MGGTFYGTKYEIWEGLGSLDIMNFFDERGKKDVLNR